MKRAGVWSRKAAAVALAAIIGVIIYVGFMTSAFAAKVAPEFVEGASNRTCSEFVRAGQTWKELKVDPPANGQKSDGTLTVTISNMTNTKTFDWSSNIGVDAVFVKAGSAGSYLYRYDDPTNASAPGEQTSDTGLTSPGEDSTNQISHIAFCYDVESTPSPSPSPSETPSESPTPTPTPTPSETPSESPTPSPSETPSESPSVLPSQFTASPSPSTSVLGEKLGRTGTDLRSLIVLSLGLLGLGVVTYLVSIRAARSRG
jgi:hypothetical protein